MVRSANNNGRGRPRVVRVAISAVGEVKRSLVARGDIAADVAFQNDVNALLAAVARLSTPAPAIEDVPGDDVRGGLTGPAPAPARSPSLRRARR